MEGKQIFGLSLIFFCMISMSPVYCGYHSKTLPFKPMEEKVTYLHFFLHDTLSGKNPTAVLIAHANNTNNDAKSRTPFPFGNLYAIDDPLTVGPEPTSQIIGNAQGLYVLSGQKALSLVDYLDFSFTTGEFNGSSISVMSRNTVLEKERELAVVGGRGKFRLGKGYAQLKAYFVNETSGDAIIEYHVTVIHH